MTRDGRRSPPQAWKWVALAAAAALLFAAGRLLPVRDWLRGFQLWIGGLGPLGGVLYGLVYVGATLLFVPGIVMTLGAGYVFGPVRGTVIVSIASTAAAALAFLIARYLARGRVQALARRNARFAAIDRAIGENGWKIVALLRLSPVVPFSLSNYLYGLTAVRFVPFIAASWAGMLPATVLYVSLGSAGRHAGESSPKSPWEWAFLGAGLLATAAVTGVLARIARRELSKPLENPRRSGPPEPSRTILEERPESGIPRTEEEER